MISRPRGLYRSTGLQPQPVITREKGQDCPTAQQQDRPAHQRADVDPVRRRKTNSLKNDGPRKRTIHPDLLQRRSPRNHRRNKIRRL